MKIKIWVAFIAALFIFGSCGQGKNKVEETGNSKFLSFIGADSLSQEFTYSEGDPVLLHLDKSQLDRKVNLSDIIADYRFLKLKNWEGGVIGDIDKILLSDSLVFILDQYTYNSLQVFDLFSGEQVSLFFPTGEGPGEMKNITEFDLDEANRRIVIYDNSLAKVLYFSYEGQFLEEKRIPLRAHSFKFIADNKILFSSINESNDHLGGFGSSDLFLLDSNFVIHNSFKYPKIDQKLSDFVPRDVIRENDGYVSYFPRFSNELLQINAKSQIIKPIIKVSLGLQGLSQEDFDRIGPEFIQERKEDKKFYGFGLHFITSNWIGMKFNRFGGRELHVYYNKRNGEVISGTGLEFDFKDLILFSFPLVCKDETCIASVKIGDTQLSDYENFFKKMEKTGRDFSGIREFLNSVHDFEQPILLVFTLR